MMLKKISKFVWFRPLIGLAFIDVSMVYAVEYDQCKDILRNGIRSDFQSRNSVDYQKSQQRAFCLEARQFQLNNDNYDAFTDQFAGRAMFSNSRSNSGGTLGFTGFSLGGRHAQASTRREDSLDFKRTMLMANRTAILDNFNNNCGNESNEESLTAESIILHKAVEERVLATWQECMKGTINQGLFVEVTPMGSLDDPNDNDSRIYAITLHWKSEHNAVLTDIRLRYSDNIQSDFNTVKKVVMTCTGNICLDENFRLINGSRYPLEIRHFDRSTPGALRLQTSTDTEMLYGYTVVLPKYEEPVNIPVVEPAPTASPTPSPTPTPASSPEPTPAPTPKPNIGSVEKPSNPIETPNYRVDLSKLPPNFVLFPEVGPITNMMLRY